MSDDQAEKESWVRRRAYQLWQDSGEGHGQHDDHWHQAEREYEQAGSTPAAAARTAGDLEEDLIETPPPASGHADGAADGTGATAAEASETARQLPGRD